MGAAVTMAAKLVAVLEDVTEDERERALAIIRGAYPETSRETLDETPETSRVTPGAARQRRWRASQASRETSRVTPGETARDASGDVSRDAGGLLGGDLGSGSLSGSPSPSEQISPVAGSTARAWNPAAGVDHFVAGVNEAGGTWPVPNAAAFQSLSRALQAVASRQSAETTLAYCKHLGGRWFAFCGGAPRSAFKAAEWLGEGAPEATQTRMGPRAVRAVQPVPEGGRQWTAGE